MSLYTWHRQGPHNPSSYATFTLNSHWGRAVTGKTESLASMHPGLLQSCPALCDPVACGLPGFSVRGVLQARVLECIGQYGCHTLLLLLSHFSHVQLYVTP